MMEKTYSVKEKAITISKNLLCTCRDIIPTVPRREMNPRNKDAKTTRYDKSQRQQTDTLFEFKHQKIRIKLKVDNRRSRMSSSVQRMNDPFDRTFAVYLMTYGFSNYLQVNNYID